MNRKLFPLLLAVPAFLIAQNANNEIHALPVQGNIYMLTGGAAGNVTVQVGSQGVLVVDTQTAAMADKLLEAIHKLSDKPIRYVINTSAASDHVGGNEMVHKAGVTITGANVTADIDDARAGAAVLAHENVLTRMSAPTGTKSPTPAAAWPTDTFLGDDKDLFFNGESVQIVHMPNALTDGDSAVYFRRSDVVSTGDLFTTDRYPALDTEKGGTIQGLIAGLNHVMALTVVAHEEEGGTLVVPGHGRLCDQADLVEYRDMVVIVRDRVRDMIKKKMTLEQVKAAHPTQEYDTLYGNPDLFVTGVYQSLSAKP